MNTDSFLFDSHFEVFLADTLEGREIHYSIRYQVYCEEMEFEKKHCFPRKLEFDDHDQHSVHFIVRHKSSGRWVGAVRLILKNDQLLPIEQLCSIQEQKGKNVVMQSAELSRLCVIKEIRRGIEDLDPPHGIDDKIYAYKERHKVKQLLYKRQNINRSVMWGLLNAAMEYCCLNNIDNWYFIITEALATVLREGGFNMSNIGKPIDHNGKRYPFKKDVVNAFNNEIWRKDYKSGYCKYSDFERSQYLAIAV